MVPLGEEHFRKCGISFGKFNEPFEARPEINCSQDDYQRQNEHQVIDQKVEISCLGAGYERKRGKVDLTRAE